MFSHITVRIKQWFGEPSSYRSEIALALACKLLLLYGLWVLCFSVPAAVPVDSEHVAQLLLKK